MPGWHGGERVSVSDAYNQKLVKKIAVRGISVKGLAGTNAYPYLESIQVSTSKPLEACVELEIRQAGGIERELRKLGRNDNLHETSGGLEQYKGFVVADIDALDNIVSCTNGVVLQAGEATGDVNEGALRRIQIREAGEQPGEYAQVFDEEYNRQLNEALTQEDTPYNHSKKSERPVNPNTAARSKRS